MYMTQSVPAMETVMFRGVLLGIMLTVVSGLACAYIVLCTGMIPANADATPGPLELLVAQKSLQATLEREAPTGPNPIAPTNDNFVAGIKLFEQHCVMCHGTAEGDRAASPVAKGLYPRPPQLASDGVEDDPEGATFWKLEHGIRWTGMPSWKGTLTDKQMWTLAVFLKYMDKLPPAAEQVWEKVQN
jgi:mono/diheme cytochrome c family protein